MGAIDYLNEKIRQLEAENKEQRERYEALNVVLDLSRRQIGAL